MNKFLVAATSALALVSVAGNANAALIAFNIVFPETSATHFADGEFGNDQGLGGFVPVGVNSGVSYTSLTHEYIRFYAPVTLNSLTIGPCGFCGQVSPISFSINLYGPSAALISSTLVNASSTPEVVDLDQSGVQKVEFSFEGKPGSNAWYEISDVSYTNGGGGGVPEPAVWSLMITGFGLVGGGLRRRRSLAA